MNVDELESYKNQIQLNLGDTQLDLKKLSTDE